MQAADRAHRFSAAEVYLGDGAITPGLREGRLLGAKGIEESSAMVGKGLDYWLKHSGYRGGKGGHRELSHRPADRPGNS